MVVAQVICFSEPVVFDPDAPIDAERERIKEELVRRITALAEELPRHRVVPYRPQPKKYWHFNRPKEATEA